jgi:ABC-2 type transport system ATP-binding protein
VEAVQADGAHWQAVPFGTSVHVSSKERDDFPAWLAGHAESGRHEVRAIEPSLEDVFISLMQHAKDNFES